MKTVGYRILWLEPLTPNGLVYFYTIYIDQYSHTGPKDERCVGHNIHSINVSLLPRTNYRLRIVTYTIARLNQEYEDNKQVNDDSFLSNATNLYYQIFFTTVDLPSKSDGFIIYHLRLDGKYQKEIVEKLNVDNKFFFLPFPSFKLMVCLPECFGESGKILKGLIQMGYSSSWVRRYEYFSEEAVRTIPMGFRNLSGL